MKPRVSVLLPVRNEERLLPAALASLQRQTLADWELVAVDDGSSDGTGAILDAAAATDSRIRVLHRPPSGLVTALNAGLAACRAPLVARMDGDDVCHPNRLQLQAGHLAAHPGTTLVASRVRHIPRQGLSDGMRAYEAWQNAQLDHDAIMRDLYVESPFTHPSVMYRRDAVLSLGGYRDCGWPEDYDLWLRLAQAGARFARLPETLLFWRDRPERMTRTAAEYALNAFRDCKVHHLAQTFLAGTGEVTLWGAGIEGKAWRLALHAKGLAVRRWLEVDPRKIGQVIHGAPVVAVDVLIPGDGLTLVTVGAKGAREQVREFALNKGLVEGTDFLCVT
ncbi:MAG: glycosyltransferase [Deltaproteobacteria bacterium]|nr:MAG: glycosyltransferase [Deltaproteobacteria bacterium]